MILMKQFDGEVMKSMAQLIDVPQECSSLARRRPCWRSCCGTARWSENCDLPSSNHWHVLSALYPGPVDGKLIAHLSPKETSSQESRLDFLISLFESIILKTYKVRAAFLPRNNAIRIVC
jgi:hypothetical protein